MKINVVAHCDFHLSVTPKVNSAQHEKPPLCNVSRFLGKSKCHFLQRSPDDQDYLVPLLDFPK